MNKLMLWVTLIFGLINCNLVIAAPDLTGKTFVMTGKFEGVAPISCKKSGSSKLPVRVLRKLHATITFNPNNAFSWTEDGLPSGALTNVTGFWTQKGNRISLDFDDDNQSGIKAMGQLLPQTFTNQGIPITIKDTKYGFSATTNAIGNQLIVMESGGFKVTGTGTLRGITDSCVARLTLKRTYKGRSI
jgi:hypothetical protein